MAPSEIDGTSGPQPVRRINPVSAQQARTSAPTGSAATTRPTQAKSTPAEATPDSPVVETSRLDVGQPPVDPERVGQIRKAVESGNYPLVPAKIADAMIAAGMFLRKGS